MILKCFALMYGDTEMQIPDAPRQTKPRQHMCREKTWNYFSKEGVKRGEWMKFTKNVKHSILITLKSRKWFMKSII